MRVEEHIVLTLSLDRQSYHTECCTLYLYYQLQLITAIYGFTLFHDLLDQPLAADWSSVMFILVLLFLKSQSCEPNFS